MTAEAENWVPRKRLRHLHSVQARSLDRLSGTTANSRVYFAIWSHAKVGKEEHHAPCLYVSDQVHLSSATEWLPIELSSSTPMPAQIHGLLSGLIHLHIYATLGEANAFLPQHEGPAHPSLQTLQIRAQPPILSPLHTSEGTSPPSPGLEPPDLDSPKRKTSYKEALEDTIYEEHSWQQQIGTIRELTKNLPSEPDAAHFVGFQQMFPPPSAKLEAPQTLQYRLCRASKPRGLLEDAEQVSDLQLCSEPKLPGTLILALSVDLEHLDCIGEDLRVLDGAHCGTKLIFQLADGRLCVWPPMPEGWSAPPSMDNGRDPDNETLSSIDAADQAEDRVGGWGGLFRRTTLGSTANLLEKELSDPAAASPSADAFRIKSLPIASASGKDLIGSTLSSASTASLLPSQAEISFASLVSAIIRLAELHQKRQALHMQTARTMHKLTETLKMREAARLQRHKIAGVMAAAGARQQQTLRCQRRAASIRNSAAAARELMQAQGTHLSSALATIEALWEHLDGPEASYWQAMRADYRALHSRLVARRCRLATDLQHVFSIRPRAVSVVEAPKTGFLWHQLDQAWSEVSVTAQRKSLPGPSQQQQKQRLGGPASFQGAASSSSGSTADDSDSGMAQTTSELSIAGSQIREVARLGIGALDLEPGLGRQRSENLAALGWNSDKEQDMRLAAALGYAAHVTHHLAIYLGIPLKYPLSPANSRSAVKDHQPPARLLSQGLLEGSSAADADKEVTPTEFLLWPDGTEQTRFSYAVFLLNKNVEQLLSAHGLTSGGPSHVLQNLYKLLSAAGSAVPPRPEWQ